MGSAVDCLQVAHLLALPHCIGIVRLIANPIGKGLLANVLLSTLSAMHVFVCWVRVTSPDRPHSVM